MYKTTLISALMLAAWLRVTVITLAIVLSMGWLAARAVGHLWLWAFTRRRHELG